MADKKNDKKQAWDGQALACYTQAHGLQKRLIGNRYLSQDDCIKLISACKPHLKPIVIRVLNPGMRKEEILSIQRERHVDLKHGLILLDLTKNGERERSPLTVLWLKRHPK